jgi:hypothetical protein
MMQDYFLNKLRKGNVAISLSVSGATFKSAIPPSGHFCPKRVYSPRRGKLPKLGIDITLVDEEVGSSTVHDALFLDRRKEGKSARDRRVVEFPIVSFS